MKQKNIRGLIGKCATRLLIKNVYYAFVFGTKNDILHTLHIIKRPVMRGCFWFITQKLSKRAVFIYFRKDCWKWH